MAFRRRRAPSQRGWRAKREVIDLSVFGSFIEGWLEDTTWWDPINPPAPQFCIAATLKELKKIGGDPSMTKWGSDKLGKDVAKIWLDREKGVLKARFPYNREVIEEFKIKVPPGRRAWNNDDKIWEFSVEAIEVVVEILTLHFSDLINLTDDHPTYAGGGVEGELFSILDEQDITRIYKLLAMRYHPDKQGGDGKKMSQINQVFTKLKKGGK